MNVSQSNNEMGLNSKTKSYENQIQEGHAKGGSGGKGRGKKNKKSNNNASAAQQQQPTSARAHGNNEEIKAQNRQAPSQSTQLPYGSRTKS